MDTYYHGFQDLVKLSVLMSMQVAILEDKFINAQLCKSHVKLPDNWFTNSTGRFQKWAKHDWTHSNAIEQSLEWNASLYTCSVDYEKAFDNVHHEILWRIMQSYGIPSQFIRMVKLFHSNTKCAVIDGAGKSDWFTEKAGVKQGCVMSGFMWIMCRTTEQGNTGILWKMMRQLEDLD